tara:strand:- start:816 stop:1277 length:462 start_codon:yes stop_codon:yes gene_type:complete
MSEYLATVEWSRGDQHFLDNQYSRAHRWHFDGGLSIAASSSPHVVPCPYSDASNVDPEEAFIASLSSCHMLFFLSLAAKAGFIIDQYCDNAVGYMEQDGDGKIWMTRVVLHPDIRFGGDNQPTREQLAHLHHQSHQRCFIANSVKTEVTIEAV